MKIEPDREHTERSINNRLSLSRRTQRFIAAVGLASGVLVGFSNNTNKTTNNAEEYVGISVLALAVGSGATERFLTKRKTEGLVQQYRYEKLIDGSAGNPYIQTEISVESDRIIEEKRFDYKTVTIGTMNTSMTAVTPSIFFSGAVLTTSAGRGEMLNNTSTEGILLGSAIFLLGASVSLLTNEMHTKEQQNAYKHQLDNIDSGLFMKEN